MKFLEKNDPVLLHQTKDDRLAFVRWKNQVGIGDHLKHDHAQIAQKTGVHSGQVTEDEYKEPIVSDGGDISYDPTYKWVVIGSITSSTQPEALINLKGDEWTEALTYVRQETAQIIADIFGTAVCVTFPGEKYSIILPQAVAKSDLRFTKVT